MQNNYTTNTTTNADNDNNTTSSIEREAEQVRSSTNIVSRFLDNATDDKNNSTSSSSAIVHLDRSQVSSNVADYYGTFIDLYIAAAARCILLGVGNFMMLAKSIGHVDCVVSFEKFPEAKKWGRNGNDPRTRTCRLPPDSDGG